MCFGDLTHGVNILFNTWTNCLNTAPSLLNRRFVATILIFICFVFYFDHYNVNKCIWSTRTLGRYAPLVLAPIGGWGTIQTLPGANKYSCILIPTFSYQYIPIIIHNRSCNSLKPNLAALSSKKFIWLWASVLSQVCWKKIHHHWQHCQPKGWHWTKQ